ncbi:hypothetical protein NEOKW01_0259 [Nematocida sp. AWRm80]|nr:hypothetical protein NEOKW01_0259 [Nematocida sp. AWRm80]
MFSKSTRIRKIKDLLYILAFSLCLLCNSIRAESDDQKHNPSAKESIKNITIEFDVLTDMLDPYQPSDTNIKRLQIIEKVYKMLNPTIDDQEKYDISTLLSNIDNKQMEIDPLEHNLEQLKKHMKGSLADAITTQHYMRILSQLTEENDALTLQIQQAYKYLYSCMARVIVDGLGKDTVLAVLFENRYRWILSIVRCLITDTIGVVYNQEESKLETYLTTMQHQYLASPTKLKEFIQGMPSINKKDANPSSYIKNFLKYLSEKYHLLILDHSDTKENKDYLTAELKILMNLQQQESIHLPSQSLKNINAFAIYLYCYFNYTDGKEEMTDVSSNNKTFFHNFYRSIEALSEKDKTGLLTEYTYILSALQNGAITYPQKKPLENILSMVKTAGTKQYKKWTADLMKEIFNHRKVLKRINASTVSKEEEYSDSSSSRLHKSMSFSSDSDSEIEYALRKNYPAPRTTRPRRNLSPTPSMLSKYESIDDEKLAYMRAKPKIPPKSTPPIPNQPTTSSLNKMVNYPSPSSSPSERVRTESTSSILVSGRRNSAAGPISATRTRNSSTRVSFSEQPPTIKHLSDSTSSDETTHLQTDTPISENPKRSKQLVRQKQIYSSTTSIASNASK